MNLRQGERLNGPLPDLRELRAFHAEAVRAVAAGERVFARWRQTLAEARSFGIAEADIEGALQDWPAAVFAPVARVRAARLGAALRAVLPLAEQLDNALDWLDRSTDQVHPGLTAIVTLCQRLAGERAPGRRPSTRGLYDLAVGVYDLLRERVPPARGGSPRFNMRAASLTIRVMNTFPDLAGQAPRLTVPKLTSALQRRGRAAGRKVRPRIR